MKNVKLIYKHVKEVKVNYLKKPIIIKLKKSIFDSDSLVYLASRFKFLYKYNLMKWTIIIDLGEVTFKDKITYLIFDSMLYDLLKSTNFTIMVYCMTKNGHLHNNGVGGTALFRSVNERGLINKATFIKNYEKPIFTNLKQYRRYLSYDTLQKNNEWPSIIYTEVASVLRQYTADDEWYGDIAEMVSELVCNVNSHTDGDCLIDIDFCDNVSNSDGKNFLSVNIAVINYSENRLFDFIKKNIKEKRYDQKDYLYNRIYRAYDTHKKFFNEHYLEDDFFLITAFQNHVTSRYYKSGSGGTGLPRLIENITGKADDDYSYVLSGNNIIFFKNEYLKLSNDRFIGFNKENDYFHYKPADEVINKTKLYVPGTIYQLLLIKEC